MEAAGSLDQTPSKACFANVHAHGDHSLSMSVILAQFVERAGGGIALDQWRL
jgi:hypothetical protein